MPDWAWFALGMIVGWVTFALVALAFVWRIAAHARQLDVGPDEW